MSEPIIEPREIEIIVGLLGARVSVMPNLVGAQFPFIIDARLNEIERRILQIEEKTGGNK